MTYIPWDCHAIGAKAGKAGGELLRGCCNAPSPEGWNKRLDDDEKNNNNETNSERHSPAAAGQNKRSHCLDHWNSPRHDTGIVAASRNQFHHLSIAAHGVLLSADCGRWLECYLGHDVLAIGESPLNSPRPARMQI